MTIENLSVIDAVWTDAETSRIVLVITDHLRWRRGQKHLQLLQDKINVYLQDIESGQLAEAYPSAKDNEKLEILVVGKYALNDDAREFYHAATASLRKAGYLLRFELDEADEPS